MTFLLASIVMRRLFLANVLQISFLTFFLFLVGFGSGLLSRQLCKDFFELREDVGSIRMFLLRQTSHGDVEERVVFFSAKVFRC